ncbi:MAG: hypothetical protein RL023_406 [Candidatus Parcubacteria bacterium]|jgi:hypothetical protein
MNKNIIFTISLLFLAHLCQAQQVVGVWDSLRLKAWQEKPCFRDYSFKKDKVPGCAKRTYKFSQKDKELWAPVLEFIELNGEVLNDTQTVFKAWDGTLRLFTNKVQLDNGQKKLVSINGPAYLAWEIRHHDNPEKFGDPHMCYDCINGRHTQKKVDFPTVKGDLCTPITTPQREIAKLIPRDTTIFGKKRVLDSCNVWFVFCDTSFDARGKIIRCDSVFAKCDTVWRTKEISTNPCIKCDSVFQLENKGLFAEAGWSPNNSATTNWLGWLGKVGYQQPLHLITNDSTCLQERVEVSAGPKSIALQIIDPACGCSRVLESSPIAWTAELTYRFLYTPPSGKWKASFGVGAQGVYHPLYYRNDESLKTLGILGFVEPRFEWRFNNEITGFVAGRYAFGLDILDESPTSFQLGGRFKVKDRQRGRK